jgi:hypothetical protein
VTRHGAGILGLDDARASQLMSELLNDGTDYSLQVFSWNPKSQKLC